MNGVLLVDKPEGCTSHDVVSRVKRKLKVKKVGHAGTLDPLASGLLIVLLGQGTKLSDYLMKGDKAYLAKVKLGLETDTQDVTGEKLSERECDFSLEQIQEQVQMLQGEIELRVPDYSAVKVGGKKLYEYAREGEEVPSIYRKWNFHKVDLIEATSDTCTVEMHCSKGAYVRAWASHLGERLGAGGCIQELRRLVWGSFHVDQAIPLGEISTENSSWERAFTPLKDCLSEVSRVELSDFEEKLFTNGQIPKDVVSRVLLETSFGEEEGECFQVVSGFDQELLGILGVSSSGGLKIERVFPRS